MRKSVEGSFSMLIKFGKYDNLVKLQGGLFYMKNLEYYINLEKDTGDEAVGDEYDGKAIIENTKLRIYDNETGNLILEGFAATSTLDLGYKKNPVYCMFMYDFRNSISQELNGNKLTLKYQFSDEQKEKLKNFGEYALIIKNGDEFISRVKKAFLNNGISFSRDKVMYYEGNILQHLEDINKNKQRIAFWKRAKYEYQQEYRFLAFDAEIDDFLCLDIGDIKDISKLIPTNDLLNSEVVLNSIVEEID